MKGYIALHRMVRNNWIWQDPQKLRAWLDIIMEAAIDDRKIIVGNSIIKLQRGQLSASERFLSERWKWSRGKVQRFLSLLESDGMIINETGHSQNVITVCNYATYNDAKNTDRPPTSHQRATDEPPTSHKQTTSSTKIEEFKELKNNTLSTRENFSDFEKEISNGLDPAENLIKTAIQQAHEYFAEYDQQAATMIERAGFQELSPDDFSKILAKWIRHVFSNQKWKLGNLTHYINSDFQNWLSNEKNYHDKRARHNDSRRSNDLQRIVTSDTIHDVVNAISEDDL